MRASGPQGKHRDLPDAPGRARRGPAHIPGARRPISRGADRGRPPFSASAALTVPWSRYTAPRTADAGGRDQRPSKGTGLRVARPPDGPLALQRRPGHVSTTTRSGGLRGEELQGWDGGMGPARVPAGDHRAPPHRRLGPAFLACSSHGVGNSRQRSEQLFNSI